MSTYLILKWLHILSSTILFGTGLGIAFFQWMSWRTGELAVIARITRLTVLADFIFTTPAVVIQLLSALGLRCAVTASSNQAANAGSFVNTPAS